MFGYVRPYKSEMKVCEYDTYKAIYCGFCRRMGKKYGFFSRITLSYDFTFLTLLQLALKDSCNGYKVCRCPFNPLIRRQCCNPSEEFDLSASLAMIMLYYKLRDNLADCGFWGRLAARLALLYARPKWKKAASLYPQMDMVMAQAMDRQSKLEQSVFTGIDPCCEPTAHALGEILKSLSADTKQQRVLYRLGYLLGRWIYLMDALGDMEKDLTKNNFNPFLLSGNATDDATGDAPLNMDEIKQNALCSLNMTVSEMAAAYQLLDSKRYQPILENIIYLGLHEMQRQIISGVSKRKEKKHDRPL